MQSPSPPFVGTEGTAPGHSALPGLPHPNTSHPQGCLPIVIDMSAPMTGVEVEAMTRHVKDFLLAFLFLIGGPANLINMAVFFKQGVKDRVNLCLFSLAMADELYLTMAIFLHGEQLYLQFTTQERFGPVATFMINNHLTVLGGFCYVSNILSAIIATERCICVVSPLKVHTLFRTRTMAIIIVIAVLLTISVQAIVAFRYHIGCVYDPVSGMVMKSTIEGEFYKAHKDFVNYLDGFMFGVGLPPLMIIIVTVMTIITAVKLRQIVSWRSTTTSSISAKELALTRMLVANSTLFIACVSPGAVIRFVWMFLTELTSGQNNQNFFLTSLWFAELFSFVNASLNIFVYYGMGSRYRETFWSLFGIKVGSEKDSKHLSKASGTCQT